MSLYLVSAAIFAALHWSNGLGPVAGTFVIRLMLLWSPRQTSSILPKIAAHYFISLVLFWT
jgi:membrane protease YdiL (CAAX protease family)